MYLFEKMETSICHVFCCWHWGQGNWEQAWQLPTLFSSSEMWPRNLKLSQHMATGKWDGQHEQKTNQQLQYLIHSWQFLGECCSDKKRNSRILLEFWQTTKPMVWGFWFHEFLKHSKKLWSSFAVWLYFQFWRFSLTYKYPLNMKLSQSAHHKLKVS